MPNERPSPFTIPEPTFRFAEGPPSEPPPQRSMTVGGLIHNLTGFAEFYERASADIERADPFEKPHAVGSRDAHTDYLQRSFRATVAMDRVRAYVLARYGEELTIGTARRLLGDLIRACHLTVAAAESLRLEDAMDRMDANDGTKQGEGGPSPPHFDRLTPHRGTPPLPAGVRNWLTARYLADPTPGEWRPTGDAEPEPVVFARYDDFAEYLLNAGVELLPNLDNWRNAGWIEDIMVDLTPSDNPTDVPPDCITRLNLPPGRHRLVGIRRTVLDAPTTPQSAAIATTNGQRESEAVGTDARSSPVRTTSTELETKGESTGDSSETLRTPEGLLHAFGKAAARFSTTGLRVAAFRNAARADGLTTIPASLIPKNDTGQPIIGQLIIGGTGKTIVPGCVTYYGVGGARLTSAGTEVNVGFVIYGRSPDDDAEARFRELGGEAGVISHLHGFGPEIQSYDNPLTLWALIVYSTLQGSAWLSEMAVVSETPAHQFNPFTASIEVMKRLAARTKTGRGEPLPAAIPSGPAPTAGAEESEGEKPPADTYADLRRFARAELKGQERAVIEALCDAGGELPIADLAVTDGVGWDDPKRGFTNAQRRLKGKLSRQGWTLIRHSNAAKLFAKTARKAC